MDGNQKLRLNIAPGSAARIAETEKKESEAPQRVTRIQAGSAARLAEAEAAASPQRPYSISMRANTGRPFTLDEEMRARAVSSSQSTQKSSQSNESVLNDSLSEPPEAKIQTTSFRPITQGDKVSGSIFGASFAQEDRSGSGVEKETQARSRSPLQTIRALFSRTSTKTVAQDEE